jgi:hypothetical protein
MDCMNSESGSHPLLSCDITFFFICDHTLLSVFRKIIHDIGLKYDLRVHSSPELVDVDELDMMEENLWTRESIIFPFSRSAVRVGYNNERMLLILPD